ncbi:2-oxoisovalerate dehydrogenase subunit alpha, mitochondrial [Phymastichus coffea]|uniref:2-oxoisovalerate dehydrogenase subunit alpha, mitochondrial n=1 Tax=Phymastichus coffea TaxID=108790 RepID=UPI00273C76EF|nr:2-oxoisovalerate dehydrogenase subunit alpha, mitochondrial [Phymastichus coffea]XP_058793333.1 2-oxoisovalerate dehydrogenase subunit alpha, mitochondrial [Phymastichus coffea]XP_058793334.1 2-oxoisovalerate dehydrogenase subunit alpha, mitochondrial [Phymastichus coffea]
MNGLRAILRLPLRSAGRNCQTAASEPTLVYTKELRFANDAFPRTIPTYRVLDDSNTEAQDCRIGDEQLVKMYESMVKLNVMDAVLYESQRQGRISFYMTNYGEEACQIGSAAALADEDPVYAQYRESGVLMWRGYDYQDFVDQCYGNAADPNKGRQMPVHYGSRRLNFLTISSPLGTQLPQAAGAAYALRLRGERRRLVACYFGEGAASEGDAHAALSFAATLRCPVLFFCRNNGYAISTPSGQQYAGDGVAAKGPAYGIPTLRVDGNDLLAVYNATGFAREFALSSQRPVLLEAMTYRLGHHSTSDDSSAYRPEREVQRRRELAPIARLSAYLAGRGLWDEQRQRRLAEASKRAVVAAVAEAERREKPHWRELFADVYARMPAHLASQMAKLDRHLREHADKYPTVGG